MAGAYLLSVTWGGYQIPGSPFKVNVACSNDASKVTVTGEGLQGGALGQDLCAVVDTRRAGSGSTTSLAAVLRLSLVNVQWEGTPFSHLQSTA